VAAVAVLAFRMDRQFYLLQQVAAAVAAAEITVAVRLAVAVIRMELLRPVLLAAYWQLPGQQMER
jgi:hypothetical protein